MKENIHPKYYDNAKVTCACGYTFTTGSTEPELKVEICSMCHPFFTGTAKLIDTAGRVDKFKARMAKKTAKDNKGEQGKTKGNGEGTKGSEEETQK